jgi:hypothetical protein
MNSELADLSIILIILGFAISIYDAFFKGV